MVDLFLSLRDVKAYAAMIDLYHRMPLPLQRAKMMREQLGFALNREGRFEEAEKVLSEVIAEFGPSSETNGLLGRIYKDRWDVAKEQGLPEARALLKNAVDTYLAGFEADWRDAYPGINAVTLMEMMREARPAPGRDPARGPLFRRPQGGQERPIIGTTPRCWSLPCWPATTTTPMTSSAMRLPSCAPRPGSSKPRRAISALIRDMREARGEDAAWIKRIEDTLKERAQAPRR